LQVQYKLAAALVLCILFLVIEFVGGLLAHSVAILADTARLLSDAAGFGISLFAAWAVTWRSHSSYSFGYHRAETIGALLSTLMIWAVTGALIWEAVQRILFPEPVDGKRECHNKPGSN
jgi:zinc transporter 2